MEQLTIPLEEGDGDEVVETDPRAGVGSSDIANMSLVCPTIHPYVSISSTTIPVHTADFRDAANSIFGYQQMLKAATTLACTLLTCSGKQAYSSRLKRSTRVS